MESDIFLQISILLAITVGVAFFVRLLRQPLLIAYIVAGMIAGPLFLGAIEHSGGTFDTLAQIGVIFLLFLVGLSLNITKIKNIGKASSIVAISQVIFTSTIGFFILKLVGFSTLSAVYMGIALTFSSTIIIVKLLSDKKDTESVYGRHVFGLMVVQDIIAVAVMLVFTTIAGGIPFAEAIGLVLIKGFAIIGLAIILSRYVLPGILAHVAPSSEFLFLFTITWCFALSSLMAWAGFSVEIGAIIAGISLGSSPYQSEISSRIKPLRDFFIVLFFIILGSEMSVSQLDAVLFPGIILSLFILFGNPFILYHSFRFLKFTRRNSFLAGVTAAQVSEFGFILIFTGVALGHLSGAELPLFTIVALITIFASSYAITYNEQLFKKVRPLLNMFGPDEVRQLEKIEDEYDVWVIGYHRIGWKVCEALKEKNVSFAVIDFNPQAISKLKHRGIPAYFGDVADVEFLQTMQIEKTKLVVSTIPEADDQLTLVKYIRKHSKKVKIICNLYHSYALEDLYEVGADYVMMPHLLGGSWVASVLRDGKWTKRMFDLLRKEQKEEMKLRFTYGSGSADLSTKC